MTRPCTATDTPIRWPRGTEGFTLAELIVVLTLAAVIVSMAAPHLRTSPALKVHRMTRLLATHLELARTHALARRVEVEVLFEETPRTYTAYVDSDKNGTISRNQAEILAFEEFGERTLDGLLSFGRGNAPVIPGDLSGDPVTLTGNALNLNVQGVPTPWGTMGTVYLVHRDDPNAVGAVTIAASGSFTAWRWNPAAEEWQ